MTEAKIARVQAAHDELAKALHDLRGTVEAGGTPRQRALTTSLMFAETSYLWFTAAFDRKAPP